MDIIVIIMCNNEKLNESIVKDMSLYKFDSFNFSSMYQYYSILDENCYFVPIFYRIVVEPYRIMR